MKKHAPATLRNRDAILAILRHELPEWGTVLEIASGSGEHAVYFAEQMAQLAWQPSDPDPEAVASIDAYRTEYDGVNLREPVLLDAALPDWPVTHADAVICANMAHITPWAATVGLIEHGAGLLGKGAPLILYGPYFEDSVDPAPSNLEFDRSLKSRDDRWGIRRVEDVDQIAENHSLTRMARYEMPANNLMLVYRRV